MNSSEPQNRDLEREHGPIDDPWDEQQQPPESEAEVDAQLWDEQWSSSEATTTNNEEFESDQEDDTPEETLGDDEIEPHGEPLPKLEEKHGKVDLAPPLDESQAPAEPVEPVAEGEEDDENLELTSPSAPQQDTEEVEAVQPAEEQPPDIEEAELVTPVAVQPNETEQLQQTVARLQSQEQELRKTIAALQDTQQSMLSEQLAQTQAAIAKMIQEGVSELEQRKQALQVSIEQLERRRERIRAEMRTTFAGVSQDLAIRVQGFKDYLVGSLQDLAVAAEQLELATPEPPPPPSRKEERRRPQKAPTPQFAEQGFQQEVRQIRKILDQYRKMPDYYGPPWQLRRTFEPVHAERVANWFFSQGGRGALKSMGSRLQNILIASAVISVLHTLYGNRLRPLVLASTPERLGEWRRGLQDCLGISRSDFSPDRGVGLFEEPSALVLKADRLVAQKQLPLILIDETEDQINLSLLQFPLWLAFAPDPQTTTPYQY